MSVVPVVSAIIENDAGEILICLRPAGKEYGGLWEFPGGKVEPRDMSLQAAIIREIKEELDITVEPYRYYDFRQHITERGDSCDLHYFRCRVVSGEPKPNASDKIQWVPVSQLLEWDLLPVDTDIAAEL